MQVLAVRFLTDVFPRFPLHFTYFSFVIFKIKH